MISLENLHFDQSEGFPQLTTQTLYKSVYNEQLNDDINGTDYSSILAAAVKLYGTPLAALPIEWWQNDQSSITEGYYDQV